jgi:hypothetical protein
MARRLAISSVSKFTLKEVLHRMMLYAGMSDHKTGPR